jgi:Co/Zn/Cd efflux system component
MVAVEAAVEKLVMQVALVALVVEVVVVSVIQHHHQQQMAQQILAVVVEVQETMLQAVMELVVRVLLFCDIQIYTQLL